MHRLAESRTTLTLSDMSSQTVTTSLCSYVQLCIQDIQGCLDKEDNTSSGGSRASMNREEEEETEIVNKFNSVYRNFPNLLLMLLAMILRRELQPLLLCAINNYHAIALVTSLFVIYDYALFILYIMYVTH